MVFSERKANAVKTVLKITQNILVYWLKMFLLESTDKVVLITKQLIKLLHLLLFRQVVNNPLCSNRSTRAEWLCWDNHKKNNILWPGKNDRRQ